MQINISARHGHLNAATSEKISEKAGKLPRFFDRVTGVYVTVDLEHAESPKVELRVTAEHVEDFVATDLDDTGNVLAAFDKVLHKVEKQLRKHKEKVHERRVPGHKHLEAPEERAGE